MIGQLPSKKLIPNQATATLKAHTRLGNYHPKGSSQTGQCLAHPQFSNYLPEGSSPIGQLPLFVCSEDESIHSRIIARTFISRFLGLNLNWVTSPKKAHSQLSNCLPSSVAESFPHSESSTCVFRDGRSPLENSKHEHLPPGSFRLAPSGDHPNGLVYLWS